jgi:hypothetical protein
MLNELVEIMGVDAVVALVKARGGVRAHVPTPQRVNQSILLDIVGVEALRKLAARCGGTALDIPLCRSWLARLMLHEGGHSHAQIARAVGFTEHTVRNLDRADWGAKPCSGTSTDIGHSSEASRSVQSHSEQLS